MKTNRTTIDRAFGHPSVTDICKVELPFSPTFGIVFFLRRLSPKKKTIIIRPHLLPLIEILSGSLFRTFTT